MSTFVGLILPDEPQAPAQVSQPEQGKPLNKGELVALAEAYGIKVPKRATIPQIMELLKEAGL